jgi:pimeloyl-ACP methyl ester carboxylesterase
MGYSMGGWIGFGLARHAPGRPRSLIVGGAHPFADESWPDAFRNVDGKDPGAFLAAFEAVIGDRIPDEARPLVLANDLRVLAASATGRPSCEEALASPRIPCLLYAGEQDRLHDRLGYIVDFWGAGYDVAERMGLLPELQRRGYLVREVRMVDRDGHRAGGFSANVFDRLTGGRYLSIARADLAACLYGAVAVRVETLSGASISRLDEDERGVQVSFDRAPPRRFDLVIGADGLHSNVRCTFPQHEVVVIWAPAGRPGWRRSDRRRPRRRWRGR